MCCRVLQGVAGCCSVLQCVAVCCSVLQCVAECCGVLRCVADDGELTRSTCVLSAWHALAVTCGITMCDMTHSYAWYDSFICLTWHIYICDIPLLGYVAWPRVTWLTHTCDTTHSFVWHDVFISAVCPCLDVWHDHVRRDSLICVTWLINLRDMTHLYLLHVTWCVVWLSVTWLTHTRDMTHSF